jgi:exopolyphosphatase/guanosine-5'-triphosphate,3'-diphosphate pyrophosphatase
MRICALDLGALSFHLLHAHAWHGGRIVRIGATKRLIRFGAGTVHTGVIGDAAWTTGLAALGAISEEIRSLRPEHTVVVATSAIREAANGHAFVAAARYLHGLDVEVLGHETEAELTYRGAANELNASTGRLAVVDIGGGSIEVAVGDGTSYRESHGAALGVLRLRDAFEIEGAIDNIEAEAVSTMVRMSLEPAAKIVREMRPDRVVFASGTARAVHRLARAVLGAGVSTRYFNYQQAMELRHHVLGRDPAELELAGVAKPRADIIAIATIVIETLMGMLSTSTVEIANWGLREGVVLRELARRDADLSRADRAARARTPTDTPETAA